MRSVDKLRDRATKIFSEPSPCLSKSLETRRSKNSNSFIHSNCHLTRNREKDQIDFFAPVEDFNPQINVINPYSSGLPQMGGYNPYGQGQQFNFFNQPQLDASMFQQPTGFNQQQSYNPYGSNDMIDSGMSTNPFAQSHNSNTMPKEPDFSVNRYDLQICRVLNSNYLATLLLIHSQQSQQS